jgi:Transposase DDE domain
MIRAAQADLSYAGVTKTLDVVLADAGYWHQIQMERLMSEGLQILVPPDANKRKGERPGWQGGLYAFMRRVLANERSGELYARGQAMVEPVFANTKFNRRCDRFLRRGRSACRSEWRLIHATHRLLKLYRHTTAPATA